MPDRTFLAYLTAVLGPLAVVVAKATWLGGGDATPFLLFFGQIVLAGAIGGLLPALVASCVSALAVGLLLIPPVGSLDIETRDMTDLLVFVVEAILVSAIVGWLHGSWRLSLESLVATRAANDRVRQAWIQRALRVGEAGHDMRRPVTRLLGQLQTARRLVVRAGEDQELAPRLDSAIESARSISGLAQQLLDAARTDAGAVAHGSGPLDLRDVVQDTRHAYSGHSPSLEVELPEHSVSVVGDRVALRRAVGNLVENALKYGSRGPVLLELVVGAAGADALVRVHDCGIGIPRDERALVFEPFFRARNSGGTTGEGLGLWIVRRIAEQHGGRAWVERSTPDRTTVTFAVPLHREMRLAGEVKE